MRLKKGSPTIATIKASDARVHFGEVLKRVHSGEARLVVEKGGIPVAAIVSMDDLETLSAVEGEVESLSREAIDRALATAGAWKDEDTDTMVSEIYRARRDIGARPALEL